MTQNYLIKEIVKMKKIIAVALMICMLAVAMCSCQPAAPQGAAVTVSVVLTDADGDELLNSAEVLFYSDAPTLEEALAAACEAGKITFDVTDYGMVEQIGNVELGSKQYWSFKVNGTDATGIKTQAVKTGDKITGVIEGEADPETTAEE